MPSWQWTILLCVSPGDVCTLRGLSACASAFAESDNKGRLPLHAAAAQTQPDVLHAVLQGEGKNQSEQPTQVEQSRVFFFRGLHCVSVAATASTELTLEEKTEDGDTALTLAAEAGSVDNVRMLLQHGASPHNTNSRNESPLLIGSER